MSEGSSEKLRGALRQSYKPQAVPTAGTRISASAGLQLKSRRIRMSSVALPAKQRRTSLTVYEQDFISNGGRSAEATNVGETNKEHEHAKRRLNESIMGCRSQLLRHEHAFLEELLATEKDPENLNHAAAVLENDPLYSGGNESIHDEEDKLPPVEEESSKIKKEHSFRRELWTDYVSQTTIIHETEIEPVQEKQHKNGLVNFFKNAFGNQNDDAKQKTTETTVEEEIIPFTVLGTGVDDQSTSPHVLSPPMMDALRPYLPFAVQQDNFWLKYSLLRDVSACVKYCNLLHSVNPIVHSSYCV